MWPWILTFFMFLALRKHWPRSGASRNRQNSCGLATEMFPSKKKLVIFMNDLESGNMLDFPNVKSVLTPNQQACSELMVTFLNNLKNEV